MTGKSAGDARPGCLALRRETPEDETFLRDLYVSMRWEEMAQLADWSDTQKVTFLHQQFGAQRTHYANAYYDADFSIVELQGKAIGRVAVFRNNSTDIRVVDIGFLPGWRNRGFGTTLLRGLFAEGKASSRSVSVHVEIFNPARRLYERLGFRQKSASGPYLLMEWRSGDVDAE